MQVTINDRQASTILAALRVYQATGMCEPTNRSVVTHEIATNGETVIALDEIDIDNLCELINFGF